MPPSNNSPANLEVLSQQATAHSHRLGFLDWRAWILTATLQIPSLRAVFKYSPHPAIVGLAMLAVAFAGYCVIFARPRWVVRIVSSAWTTVLVIAMLAGVAAVVYPIADGLRASGRGSSFDDAMKEPIYSLLHGERLYDARLYDGTQISPGPAWILLNAPLVLLHGYHFITPIYLAGLTLIVGRHSGSIARANLMLLLIASGLIIWDMTSTGHDLVAIGSSIVILYILADYAVGSKSWWPVLAVGLLVGVIATSRIIFIAVPMLIGLLYFWQSPRRALVISAIGLFSGIAWHVAFYVTSDLYQPFHLFDRGGRNVGQAFTYTGAVATAICGLMAAYRLRRHPGERSAWLAAGLLTPLVFIAFGELQSVGFNLARWEGGNYLVPAIPAIAFMIAPTIGPLQDRFTSNRAD